jgi:serum/glucocorticoid-regulated kinase 2
MQDFEMLKLLRKSSSGRILQVRKRGSGQLYALKEIRKTSIVFSQETEAAGVFGIAKQSVLHQVKNPFLVPIKFIFQSPESLHLVSAFVPGGELFDMLYKEQCFDVDTIRLYTAETLYCRDSLCFGVFA